VQKNAGDLYIAPEVFLIDCREWEAGRNSEKAVDLGFDSGGVLAVH
jgi:hypothetical protein